MGESTRREIIEEPGARHHDHLSLGRPHHTRPSTDQLPSKAITQTTRTTTSSPGVASRGRRTRSGVSRHAPQRIFRICVLSGHSSRAGGKREGERPCSGRATGAVSTSEALTSCLTTSGFPEGERAAPVLRNAWPEYVRVGETGSPEPEQRRPVQRQRSPEIRVLGRLSPTPMTNTRTQPRGYLPALPCCRAPEIAQNLVKWSDAS